MQLSSLIQPKTLKSSAQVLCKRHVKPVTDSPCVFAIPQSRPDRAECLV